MKGTVDNVNYEALARSRWSFIEIIKCENGNRKIAFGDVGPEWMVIIPKGDLIFPNVIKAHWEIVYKYQKPAEK